MAVHASMLSLVTGVSASLHTMDVAAHKVHVIISVMIRTLFLVLKYSANVATKFDELRPL